MQRISVLVADDSEFWLRHLPPALERDPKIKVVGTASGAKSGLGCYGDLNPDVVVADVFLGGESRNLVRTLVREHRACVVGTGAASRESELRAGAILLGLDPVLKPPAMVCSGLAPFMQGLIAAVKASHTDYLLKCANGCGAELSPFPGLIVNRRPWTKAYQLTAMAASTGGTQALEEVLAGLPVDYPTGIVMVQHLSNGLAEALAERLASHSAFKVEVVDRPRPVRPGYALLGKDGRHVEVRRTSDGLTAFPDDSHHLTLYRPSADVLFASAAEACGARTIGVMLSGMGDDGCRGLKQIKERGGLVLAQDADSSVVFGMPGAAIACGAADAAVPLDEMAAELTARCLGPEAAFSLS